MYKLITNNETGIVHRTRKDQIHSVVWSLCGLFCDYTFKIYNNNSPDNITCENCRRILGLPTKRTINVKSPYLSVDAIIRINNKLVFIKRKNPPHGIAFPGGFVDYRESCEDAVIREVKEETNLYAVVVKQLGVYSDPKRDKRAHIVSVAFILDAKGTPVAADDAKEVFVTTLYDAVKLKLVVDHHQMLMDYIKVINA